MISQSFLFRRLQLQLLCGLTLLLLATPAAGEVRIKTLPDGSTMIYNETPRQAARRTAVRLFPVPVAKIAALIDAYALHYGISPRLVQAIMQVESGYNVRALSHKGAMGLMQLMPATARELGVRDPWDPAQNIAGGVLYLRRQLDRFGGDLTRALAAYNAGPTAVERYEGVPPYRETRSYVRKVLSLYRGRATAVQASTETARKKRTVRKSAQPPTAAASGGAKVYLTRDENNQIVFTTRRPRTDR